MNILKRANYINSMILIIFGLYNYFARSSITVLIPLFFGLILFSINCFNIDSINNNQKLSILL